MKAIPNGVGSDKRISQARVMGDKSSCQLP